MRGRSLRGHTGRHRHIDTATAYGNETAVGTAIRRAVADGICMRAKHFEPSFVRMCLGKD